MSNLYEKNQLNKLNIKLNTLRESLPTFTDDFFRGIADRTQIKTRIAYAYDLKIFFYYLFYKVEKFNKRIDDKNFTVEDLDLINALDIEKFVEFLNFYQLPHYKDKNVLITHTNTANGKMRKLATLRSFYNYYYKKERIKNNPTVLVDMPRLKEKSIIKLEPNEVVDLLDEIETGAGLTRKQLSFHKKNKKRDLAIISLLVGTGIRVSECSGLSISDFDFNNNSFMITRKGGNKTILYLPSEVKEILKDYLYNDRMNILCLDKNDDEPMFLNLKKERLSTNGIQRMLEKYSMNAIPLKHISPHKLRSTFGTNLYKQTGDIYLVADVLGHKDVNTTKKHYAAMDEERKKEAAKVTVLRKKDESITGDY